MYNAVSEFSPSEWLAREPTLCELLDDPIVARVMYRDGVSRGEIAALFAAPAALASRGRTSRGADPTFEWDNSR
jgi:hypothetical protein